MTTVSLEGLQSGMAGEDRAIAILKVDHSDQTYDWQIYVPAGVDLSEFIAGCAARVGAEIDAWEAQWASFPEGEKSDVVRPDIPDYYARRRAEYPAMGDQLDAQWKGGDAAAVMQTKIQVVKDKYPKPSWL
jgi:hypothetical protein